MENETLRAFRERRSERLREKVRRDNEEFESKHPRNENGKFTSGSMHATTKDTPKIRAVVRAEAISKKMGITLKASRAKEFREIFHKARGNVKKNDAWRVDASYTIEDYENMECYNTPDGGSFAIHDGDIVSVCRGEITTGKELLKAAVEAGGNKLDAFEGIAGFYLACGFEPVSWTPFDENYAPEGWKESGSAEEDVIFFRYTGKRIGTDADGRKEYMQQWKKNHSAYTGKNGYEDAYAARDRIMEGK